MKMAKKLKILIVLVIFFLSFTIILIVANPVDDNSLLATKSFQNQNKSYWNRSYGGSSYDWAKSIIKTSDGGYVFTGSTLSKGNGLADLWLIKVNSNGLIEWDITYGSENDEWANDVIKTHDGGYILTGVSYSQAHVNSDLWVLKTDSMGEIEWARTYGGLEDEKGNVIIEITGGNYIIAGSTTTEGFLNKDGIILAIDSAGQPLWNRTYGGTGIDWFNAILEVEEGYMITGLTHSIGFNNSDMWVVKTDFLGNIIWNQTYGGTKEEAATCIVESSENKYVLSGFTRSFGTFFSRDGWIIQINQSGDMIWNKSFGGVGYDTFFDSIVNEQQEVIVVGTSASFGEGGLDMWILAITDEGELQWQETLGSHNQLEVAYSVIQSGKNEYTLVGTTAILANKSEDLSGSLPEHWNYVDQRDILLMKIHDPTDSTTSLLLPILPLLILLPLYFKRRR